MRNLQIPPPHFAYTPSPFSSKNFQTPPPISINFEKVERIPPSLPFQTKLSYKALCAYTPNSLATCYDNYYDNISPAFTNRHLT